CSNDAAQPDELTMPSLTRRTALQLLASVGGASLLPAVWGTAAESLSQALARFGESVKVRATAPRRWYPVEFGQPGTYPRVPRTGAAAKASCQE
ncbi:MAG: hypothetical protein WD001_02190, partial [Woeseia sp.]